MKRKIIVVMLLAISSLNIYSQQATEKEGFQGKSCSTIGVLNGGGSLIGFDFETLLTKQFGFQLGAGVFGFGGGLNYHFQPDVRSCFLSLQYYNQGFIGNTFVQNAVGPCYVFRARKLFTFQIGFAFIINRGPAYSSSLKETPAMLTYSVGLYFPSKK